ncbi:MAG: hypothetical protein HKM23_01910 [Nitrosopumilus sp.]|nr:hypothetical protein [Nitrosopumilus sp.]
MKSVEGLEEFVKWHLEILEITIQEIISTSNIELSDSNKTKEWAKKFLKNYEEKIRIMRSISNKVFERYHQLNNLEFKKIIEENKNKEGEIKELQNVFLNKNGLLIGRIIFAYRETWFLAKQTTNPKLNLTSIKEYQDWAESNLPNLIETKISLEKIHKEIAKWKE